MKFILTIFIIFLAKNSLAKDYTFFSQIGFDPFFSNRKIKEKNDLRYNLFEGTGYQFRFGYKLETTSFFASYKKSNMTSTFDTVETDLKQSSLGLGVGYHYNQNFLLGLELNQLDIETISPSNVLVSYDGYSLNSFVQANYPLNNHFYIFMKFDLSLISSIKRTSSDSSKYKYQGRSLDFGIGGSF